MHVIVAEGLHDRDFVARHTVGFDALAAHLEHHSPAWAAPITGVPAERIAALARLYAATRPASILLGGSSMHKDANGWTAELRIPFNQLRFTTADDQTWGLQIERLISKRQEHVLFSFTPKSEPGGVPAFGDLVGLRVPPESGEASHHLGKRSVRRVHVGGGRAGPPCRSTPHNRRGFDAL